MTTVARRSNGNTNRSIALAALLASCCALLGCATKQPAAPSAATTPEAATLSLEVFVSGPKELNATSALIMGPTEMMVVEAQGTKSAAIRLADRIEETGLQLRYVFLAHGHLDHSQGATILLDRFPEASFIAVPEVARLQRHRIPFDDAIAKARFGENAAVPSVEAQDYLEGRLYIDGFEIEIWSGLVGDVGPAPATEPHTAIYVPTLNALIPSDIVYFNAHMMMGETESEDRLRWAQQIDGWIERGFDVVVPGHMPATSHATLSAEGALVHSRDYILAYDRVMSESKSSEEVIAKMQELYPGMQHTSALYLGTWLNFHEMRNISFTPDAKAFPEGATEAEIAAIDRERYDQFRTRYNPADQEAPQPNDAR